jgi:hypothetical protein
MGIETSEARRRRQARRRAAEERKWASFAGPVVVRSSVADRPGARRSEATEGRAPG